MTSEQALKTRTPSQRRAAKPTPANDERFLGQLGERVRTARERTGLTRKDLATESGVSERYLAQLESGQGNISVLLLQKVATALDLSLAELFSAPDEQAAELSLIQQFLTRLPTQQLSKVRAQLIREFGGGPLERTKRIALIGLRGAGKSSLGARLAQQLGVPFIELDREVEREAGTSLSEIFLLYGQSGYRRYERRCLERVLRQHERCVMATGGSIVSEPGTYDLLLSACYTIWLKALPEEHMARVVAQGDTRPMAGNAEAMDDLRRILEGRAALYGQADTVVDTAGRTLEQSLKDLRKAIRA
jgi:XRE family aerobic/anaerobic benzoate catabolism transcriptional regulator